MRKGYVVTWDGLLSLSFVLFLLLGFISIQFTTNLKRGTTPFDKLHSVAENAVDTVNKQGVLEKIGYYWASGNLSIASNISKGYFDPLVPENMGYRLEIIDQGNVYVIYETGDDRPPAASADDQTRAFRFVSGYGEDAPRAGWVARAWMQETNVWEDRFIFNKSGCRQQTESMVVDYDPSTSTGPAFFYVNVPEGVSLTDALVNISFRYRGNVTQETSTSSSSSSSASTSSYTYSSSILPTCHDCPVINPDCEIVDGQTNKWGTQEDSYNYHSFVLSENCTDITVNVESWNTFLGDRAYDMYVNWESGQCQRPAQNPHLATWDCNTYYQTYGTNPVTCSVTDIEAGEYTIMVDCWSPVGGQVCDGNYTVYINSNDPNCDIVRKPTTTTTTTIVTTTTSSTTTTTTTLLANGAACTLGTECTSGNCGSDYDLTGSWCAPSGSCVHSDTMACDATCYGYVSGSYGPDCYSATSVYNCMAGSWQTGVSCGVCLGDGLLDQHCVGLWRCSEPGGGASASCSSTGCNTDGNSCYRCLNHTQSGPGSDTKVEALCSEGVCDIDQVQSSTVCDACNSCTISVGDAQASCDALGINNYINMVEDQIDAPGTCLSPMHCDGSGTCVSQSSIDCSPVPEEITYTSVCGTTYTPSAGDCSSHTDCFEDPSQTFVCLDGECVDYDCADAGSEDANTVRLSYRAFSSGQRYSSTYMDGPSDKWAEPYIGWWAFEYIDDDDVSIGDTSAVHTKHGEYFDIDVDVGSGATQITFTFSALAEGNVYSDIKVYDETGSTLLGSCEVGSHSGSPDQRSLSRWDECNVSISSGFADGTMNTFRIKYDPPSSGICGFSRACTLFMDYIGITCTG